jgi:hypothetical protein
MRTETRTVRIGEDMGPIDWDHDIAKDKSAIWHEAEKAPFDYLFNGREIIKLCMYDGWPYWTPTPAIFSVGPLNSGEWTFFNSYDVREGSVTRRAAVVQRSA